MFEFEATTYEIIRYVYAKRDRPAKCVDQTPCFNDWNFR
jgi:hypothetical protein